MRYVTFLIAILIADQAAHPFSLWVARWDGPAITYANALC